MQISINIEKRYMYLLVALVVFLAGIIVVIAYNPSGIGGNPAVAGHSADELTYNNTKTLEAWIIELINQETSGIGQVTCPITPYFQSGASQKIVSAKTLESGCYGGGGCIIKQVIYDSKEIKFIRQYSYVQYSSSNPTERWWSSYRTAGDALNGPSTPETAVVPDYNSLKIRDDGKEEVGELKSQWTVIDDSGSYGMTIYICSEV